MDRVAVDCYVRRRMVWRPFSKRGTARTAEDYDALHDGIPDWLKASVWGWIDKAMATLCQTVDPVIAEISRDNTNERNYIQLLLAMEREYG